MTDDPGAPSDWIPPGGSTDPAFGQAPSLPPNPPAQPGPMSAAGQPSSGSPYGQAPSGSPYGQRPNGAPGPGSYPGQPAFPPRLSGPPPFGPYGEPPAPPDPLRWWKLVAGLAVGLAVPTAWLSVAPITLDAAPVVLILAMIGAVVMVFFRPTRWFAVGALTAIALYPIILAGLCFASLGGAR